MRVRPFAEKDGYTAVHNSVFDTLMPILSASAFKVLMFVLRKTRGWGKDTDRLSYGQITAGTGIASSATLSAAIQELKDGGYILTTAGSRWKPMTYALNAAFEVEWQPVGSTSEIEAHDDTPCTSEIEVTSKTEVESASEIEAHSTSKIEDTGRKDEEKRRKGSRVSRKRDDAPSTPAAIRLLLADVCLYDLDHGLKAQVLEVNTQAAALWQQAQKQQKTEADVVAGIRRTAEFCKRKAWECKNGAAPTPTVIRKYWRAAFEEGTNGKPIRQDPRPDASGFQWRPRSSGHVNGTGAGHVDGLPGVRPADTTPRDEGPVERPRPPLLE